MRHTRAQRVHVDHEISQVLELAREFASPTCEYPTHIRRAMRVAYAAHFRALMEFFHDGRPPRSQSPVLKDIVASDFLPPRHANPNQWTQREKKRFAAADKLVAHLSEARTRRHHMKREWGGPEDHAILEKKILAFFAAQPKAREWFPNSAALLDHGRKG